MRYFQQKILPFHLLPAILLFALAMYIRSRTENKIEFEKTFSASLAHLTLSVVVFVTFLLVNIADEEKIIQGLGVSSGITFTLRQNPYLLLFFSMCLFVVVLKFYQVEPDNLSAFDSQCLATVKHLIASLLQQSYIGLLLPERFELRLYIHQAYSEWLELEAVLRRY